MNTKNIARYLWNGQRDRNWYHDCEAVLSDVFGKSNLQTTAKLMAATSIHSSLKSNLRQFRKAKHELESGQPFSGYLPVVKIQLEHIRAGRPLSGRKISNFAEAMSGNRDAVVVDIWIMRAFGFGDKEKITSGLKNHQIDIYGESSANYDKTNTVGRTPTKKQYDQIEEYIQTEAVRMGLEPREFCAMIWSGIRTEETGKHNTTRYSDYIRAMFAANLFDTVKNF